MTDENHFEEEDDMTPETKEAPNSQESQEKTPGVYVRTGKQQPQEIDMLWSGRHYAKEDRSPILFIVVGVLFGIIVSTIIFFLFTNRPQISEEPTSSLATPIENEVDWTPKADDPTLPQPDVDIDLAEPEIIEPVEPVQATPKAAPKPTTSPKPALTSSKTHYVKSGETLETIAKRYYGSGAPKYINKIARANNLRNPNFLRLNQKLVIPPSNY